METMMLPVELTEDERNARGRELARMLELYDQAEVREKMRAKAAKKELEEQKTAVRALQQAVYEGVEERPVEVYTRYDYAASLVRKYRADNHDIASSRAMTEEEKQSNLFDDAVPTTKTTVGKADTTQAPGGTAPKGKAEAVFIDMPLTLADEATTAKLDEEVRRHVVVDLEADGISELAWYSWLPRELNHDLRVEVDGDVQHFSPGQHFDVVGTLCTDFPEGAPAEEVADALSYRAFDIRMVLGRWRQAGTLQLLADGRFRPVRPGAPELGAVEKVAEESGRPGVTPVAPQITETKNGALLPLSVTGLYWGDWGSGDLVDDLWQVLRDEALPVGELAVRLWRDTPEVGFALGILRARGMVALEGERWRAIEPKAAAWSHKWPAEWRPTKRWPLAGTSESLGAGHLWLVLEALDHTPGPLMLSELQDATGLSFGHVDKAIKLLAKEKMVRQQGDGWEIDLVGRQQSGPPAADTRAKKKRGKSRAEEAVDDAMDSAGD